MALNPALREMVATAQATYEPDEELRNRELLLNEIGNRLERIHAVPSCELVDTSQEATDLLEMVEAWTAAFHRDGYLIFRDPADDVVTLEP